jgi:protein-disulfide isomerase
MRRSTYLTRLRLLTALALLTGATAAACEASPSAREPVPPPPTSAPAAAAAPDLSPDAAAPADTIDLRKLGYARGSATASVTVYEFSDFGCPFCGSFALGTYPELHEEFVKTGKVRWVMVPFVTGMFPNGAEAARAAECAGEQEDFWPMHDLLFERQKEWKASRSPAALFQDYAGRLKLDAKRFSACYGEDRRAGRTALNNRAADAAGVRATPSFLVGGRLVEGALPAAQFRLLLNQLTASRP